MFVCQRVVRRGWRINQSIAINQSINQHQAAWTHVRTRTHTHAQRPAAFDFWDALPCHAIMSHIGHCCQAVIRHEYVLVGARTCFIHLKVVTALVSKQEEGIVCIRALQKRRLRHRNRAETRAHGTHTHTHRQHDGMGHAGFLRCYCTSHVSLVVLRQQTTCSSTHSACQLPAHILGSQAMRGWWRRLRCPCGPVWLSLTTNNSIIIDDATTRKWPTGSPD